MIRTLILLVIGISSVYAATPTVTADKKAGTITVYYPDTQTQLTQPALFGKVISNELNKKNYDLPGKFDGITPAGTFPLTKIYSWQLNEDMLVYIRGKSSVGAIHPLWMKNPRQQRVERLRSPSPDDNRVTGGCINVDRDFFYNVLTKLPQGTTLTILSE